MSYAGGLFDAQLAVASGEDAALFAELRAAFVDSARRQADLLARARCDANWRQAAERLRGLALTFHVGDLAELAGQALHGAPGDPAVQRRIGTLIAAIAATA